MSGDPASEHAGASLRRQYDQLMLHLVGVDDATGDTLMRTLIDAHQQWSTCDPLVRSDPAQCLAGARQLVRQARQVFETSPGAAYGFCLLAMHLESLARPDEDALLVRRETTQLIDEAYAEWHAAQTHS